MASAPPETGASGAAEAAKQRGNAEFKSGNYRSAVREYTEAIEQEPAAAAVLLLNRAAALMALGEYQRALADCRQSRKAYGDAAPAKALVRQARCELSLGDTDAALQTLAPLTTGSEGTEAERASAAEAAEQARRVAKHIASYWTYRAQKNWTLASIALDQAQSSAHVTEATSPVAWRILRAYVHLQRGQISQAHAIASNVYRAEANSTDALLLVARVMLANNDIPKAISQAQNALRNDPDRADVKRFLRKCKALQALKDEAGAAFKAGRNDEALGKYAEIIQAAEQDADQDAEPKKFLAIIYSNRAILLARLARHADAIADCTTALELDPGYTKPLRTRARSHLANEAYEEAVRDFKQACEESAGTPEADSLRRELRQAELDLKRSKKKDYYKILGVPKTADGSEIKKAFRRESLKHHPDKGGDEEKFKLCNEAYDTLSDDDKRRRYDSGVDDMDIDPMGGFGGGAGGVNLAAVSYTHLRAHET